MYTFNADKPITGDTKNPDLLNRKIYSERIAKALILNRDSDSLVVSIEGKWGSGKTSVLNLIKRSYQGRKDIKPIIFEFNPWLIGDKDNLINSFLIQFAATISTSGKGKAFKQATKRILSFSKLFTDTFLKIPNLEPKSQSIAKIVSMLSAKGMILLDRLDEFNAEKEKNNVIKALKELDRPVVTFIDDIDRLPPEEVYVMMRILKAVSEFPRIAFVVAFEPTYVAGSLNNYKVPDAENYLDKLIQVRINLPIFTEQNLSKMFDAELSRLPFLKEVEKYFPEDGDRFPQIYHMAIKYLIETPRDIKRIFNRTQISQKATLGEVSFVDSLCLDVLSIKAPRIYEHIRMNPYAYIGTSYGEDLFLFKKPIEVVKDNKEDRERLIGDGEKAKYIKELIKELFPYIDNVNFDIRKYRTAGRVAVSDRLAIAMSIDLPSHEVSVNIIKQFIESKDYRNEILSNVIRSDKVLRFAELLNDRIASYNLDDIDDYRDFIFKVSTLAESDEAEKTYINFGSFKANCVNLIFWTVLDLLKKNDDENRKLLSIDLVSKSETLTVGTELFRYLLNEFGYFEDSKEYKKEKIKLVDQGTLDKIGNEWKSCVSRVVEENQLDAITAKYRIFVTLVMFDEELCREIVKKLIETDEGFKLFAKSISIGGQDSNKGYYAKVGDEFLSRFGDPSGFKKKAKEILAKGIPEDSRVAAGLKAIEMNKSIYVKDLTVVDDPF